MWKDIKDYEGLYQVSSNGEIRSLDRIIIKSNGKTQLIRGTILKQHPNKTSKYLQIGLWKNNVRQLFYVHKLVGEMFLENEDNKKRVNYIDGNINNNCISNLEWTTDSENLQHSYDVLKRVVNKSKGHRKLNVVTPDGDTIYCKSVAEASRLSGVSETQIRRLWDIDKESKQGYRFKKIA